MDGKTDIQKSNPLVRFFDKQTVRTNPFGANQSADRAYRRAERLVAALFLVTNHISADEPIRVSIRSGALRRFWTWLRLTVRSMPYLLGMRKACEGFKNFPNALPE